MKSRIGVITASKESFEPLSGNFPDAQFHYSANILEFYQANNYHKFDLIIFHAPDGTSEADLLASLKFLRTKQAFSKLPVLLLHIEKGLPIKVPVKDPYLRAFLIGPNLFINILDFLSALQSPEVFEKPFQLSENTVENSFTNSLKKRMGVENEFSVRNATDDEAHASYFCQLSSEISTNLFWIKFTARILEKGNSAFTEMFKNFSESEKDEMATQLLDGIMKDFLKDLEHPLEVAGAVAFPSSDVLEFEHRKSYVKTAKNRALIFESDVCRLVLESTQYI